MYSLRLSGSSYSYSTGLGFALGRLGGKRGGGAAPAAGLVAPQGGGRRSVSATSNAAAPVSGDQGVGMDPAKQQQQQAPPQHAPEGKKKQDDNTKKTEHGDVMSHSFGEGYSTRSDEEGFGGVYGQTDDPVFKHPPEYDTSQGSEVKEKEKGRHVKDDKHAT